jgi:uncharacterized membrane protein
VQFLSIDAAWRHGLVMSEKGAKSVTLFVAEANSLASEPRNWFAGARPISGRSVLIIAESAVEKSSMNNRVMIVSALAVAVIAPNLAAAQGGPAPVPSFKSEKCCGLAKAGSNDCAATGVHSCAGTSTINADPRSWIYVPEGYCSRIVGGSRRLELDQELARGHGTPQNMRPSYSMNSPPIIRSPPAVSVYRSAVRVASI